MGNGGKLRVESQECGEIRNEYFVSVFIKEMGTKDGEAKDRFVNI